MLSLADDILAKAPWFEPDMAGFYTRVRESLGARDEAAAVGFDTSCVKASYRVAHDDASFLAAFENSKPPRRCGWIEWIDHGQRLGLWWQSDDDDELLMDVCCFLRTQSGETAMLGALSGYRFGSTKLKLSYSTKMIKNDEAAVRAISDYLRFFAAACALLNRPLFGG